MPDSGVRFPPRMPSHRGTPPQATFDSLGPTGNPGVPLQATFDSHGSAGSPPSTGSPRRPTREGSRGSTNRSSATGSASKSSGGFTAMSSSTDSRRYQNEGSSQGRSTGVGELEAQLLRERLDAEVAKGRLPTVWQLQRIVGDTQLQANEQREQAAAAAAGATRTPTHSRSRSSGFGDAIHRAFFGRPRGGRDKTSPQELPAGEQQDDREEVASHKRGGSKQKSSTSLDSAGGHDVTQGAQYLPGSTPSPFAEELDALFPVGFAATWRENALAKQQGRAASATPAARSGDMAENAATDEEAPESLKRRFWQVSWRLPHLRRAN